MVSSVIPNALSATETGSFAYHTIKNRLPVTITKAIDLLTRSRTELIQKYGEESDADIKKAIEGLSELRYELQTDKRLKTITDDDSDASLWNDAIKKIEEVQGEENLTWFKGAWLFSECYLYRRIRQIMLMSKSELKNYDPFTKAKIETCELGSKSVSDLVKNLCPLEKFTNDELMSENFQKVIKAVLWANKNDLSLSSGSDVSSKSKDFVEVLKKLDDNIICSHIDELWTLLIDLKSNKLTNKKHTRIDIVLDNCGIELASDLILADFLLRHNFADQVFLHAKRFPWFISDVTKDDYDYLIQQFRTENSISIDKFQQRLTDYKDNKQLIIDHENQFWTLSHSYDKMKEIAPELYNDFKANSSLVFLKGDLNYRKLIGDLNWPHDTSLSIAVREFKPTNLCAVRTLKADLVANLDLSDSKMKKIKAEYGESKDWMNTGDYGVIQVLKVDN